MIKLAVTVFACLFSLSASAEDSAIARLFAQRGIAGTLVLMSLDGGQTFIHDDARANQRLSPASTFKILNTLIAVEEKAISSKEDVLKWDGHPYAFPAWNQDQTLASAFKVSCVWCYQALARRVGAPAYRHYLQDAGYGELPENFELTRFWLDGSLEISALEQVEFLKKLYQRTLPFAAASYDTLRQIMLVEQTPTFSLYAKTGWAAQSQPQIGWYVGYLETARDVWLFATNIDIRNETDLPLRQQLTREALQTKGIIQN